MRALVSVLAFLIFGCGLTRAQDVPYLPEAPQPVGLSSNYAPTPQAAAPESTKPARRVILFCPGEFPTNVMVRDCSFSQGQRWNNFVISSLTDQAVLGSVVGALGGQFIRSPAEWPRTWHYYGYRLAASYSGGVARGTVEFAIGTVLHSDPRHVRCSEDPLTFDHFPQRSMVYKHCYGVKGQAFYRPLHVFTDAFTVRHSQPDGKGSRYPAIERYVGVYGMAYASYPWQPQAENNFAAVSRRAGLNYLFTFLGSAWNEYGPSITARFHRTTTQVYP